MSQKGASIVFATVAVATLLACGSGRDVAVATIETDAATTDGMTDANATGSALDASPDGTSTSGPGVHLDAAPCAWVEARAERVPPTVWFAISHSGGILFEAEYGAPWNRLYDALFATGGLIPRYESVVRFGAVFHGDESASATCPTLTALSPKRNGASELTDLAETLALEPAPSLTGYALRYIGETPPPPEGETVVVVAKGGIADIDVACIDDIPPGFAGNYGITLMEEAARDLASRGIRLFVVEFSARHAPTAVAASLASIGNSGHEAFMIPTDRSAGDEAALDDAFQTILAESVSCEFALNGTVTPGRACEGEVALGGAPLTCDHPDGWRLVDESHIELTGEACERLRSDVDAQVSSRFPCGAIMLI